MLERLLPSDAEVVDDLGRWYLRHIVPYRTDDNRIDGVVVTFTEITERKRWEQEVQAAREFAESIVDTVREPLLVLTPELKVRSANASFYRTFKVDPGETAGQAALRARQPAVGHPGAASAAGGGAAHG